MSGFGKASLQPCLFKCSAFQIHSIQCSLPHLSNHYWGQRVLLSFALGYYDMLVLQSFCNDLWWSLRLAHREVCSDLRWSLRFRFNHREVCSDLRWSLRLTHREVCSDLRWSLRLRLRFTHREVCWGSLCPLCLLLGLHFIACVWNLLLLQQQPTSHIKQVLVSTTAAS